MRYDKELFVYLLAISRLLGVFGAFQYGATRLLGVNTDLAVVIPCYLSLLYQLTIHA